MTTADPAIPPIHLLCMEERFADAFHAASEKHKLPDTASVTVHDCALSVLPPSVKFDLVVSPANSYGRLDGAFDMAISRAFSPTDDFLALTREAQAQLYRRWRGFAPPGSCTLLRIPEEFDARSRNVWGTRYVALCPTMRVPDDADWDREIVYECVWSLLCAVDNHNREGRGRNKIGSILMTPLATGVGRVSPERWAGQAVLALKHFVEASECPEKWGALEWDELMETAGEVAKTWTSPTAFPGLSWARS